MKNRIFLTILLALFTINGNCHGQNNKIRLIDVYQTVTDWNPIQNEFIPSQLVQENFEQITKQSKDTTILICDILILKQYLFNLKSYGQSYGLLSENEKINDITRFAIKHSSGKLQLTRQDISSGFIYHFKYKGKKRIKNLVIKNLIEEIKLILDVLEKSPW